MHRHALPGFLTASTPQQVPLTSPKGRKNLEWGREECRDTYIFIATHSCPGETGQRQTEMQGPIRTEGNLIFPACVWILIFLIPLLEVLIREWAKGISRSLCFSSISNNLCRMSPLMSRWENHVDSWSPGVSSIWIPHSFLPPITKYTLGKNPMFSQVKFILV